MASLEELLEKEGFKKGKRREKPRNLSGSMAKSMPLYPMHQANPLYREDSRDLKGRAKSDAFSRRSHSMIPEKGGARRVISRNSLPRRTESSLDMRGNDMVEIEGSELRRSRHSLQVGGLNGRSSMPRPNSGDGFRDDESIDGDSNEIEQSNGYKQRHRNESTDDEKSRSKNNKNYQVKPSFNVDSQNKSRKDPGSSSSEPALDEAAIQAVVSILTGYIRRFFKDENFRASVRRSCGSCLGVGEAKESNQKDSGVVTNLKEAIATTERVAKMALDPRELKKASLKLSVITGLSSPDLKDGYTSGIPNSVLAACAHLYLSVIYKFQKKDRVSAKHLLQVFCDSPYQARTTLFPALWDHLFLPHLSHLRAWYEKEAEAIPRTPSRLKKVKLLEKVYSNILDMGTYQFAVYYKDWIMEESEAPALPSVQFPSASLLALPQEDSHVVSSGEDSHVVASGGVSSSDSSISSQPMISKTLYESMFSQSRKIEDDDEMKSRDKDEEEEEEEEEIREVQEEVEEAEPAEVKQLTVPIRKSEELKPTNKETRTYSTRSGTNIGGHTHQDHRLSSFNVNALSDAEEWTAKKYYHSSRLNIPEKKEINLEGEKLAFSGSTNAPSLIPSVRENELTLQRLAQAVFQPQAADLPEDVDAVTLKHSPCTPATDLHRNNLSNGKFTKSELRTPGIKSMTSEQSSWESRSSAGSFRNYEDIDHGSFFSSIPKEFLCPLTGQLFKDPVTLETGQTFERASIKEWFDEGNRKCPVTGRTLECLSVPTTNFVLKRVIDGWKSEYCRNLLVLATQIAGDAVEQGHSSKDESALSIIEQLLTGFSTEEQMENAKHLISLGGLHFLSRRLELGNVEEKTRVVSLLLCCIKADGCCRSYLAMNIKGPCILDLLHSKQVAARSSAVLLLIELICLNRRLVITSFLSGLHTEAIVNTMHVLLVYLQSSPAEEKALVALLILHLDLMVEPRRYSIYREEAVDGIILALECCLSDEKIILNSRRALLMLGGRFSSSGEALIETWLLKQAGFIGESGGVSFDLGDEIDEDLQEENEAMAREEWLKNMALVLLSNGKRSFLDALSKCLGSANLDLVRVCLATAAWLSHALAYLRIAEFQLSAFSVLVPWLKEILKNGVEIEHRILASLSLLNFSMIPECRVLLMKFTEEMCDPLRSLLEVTGTAEQLYVTIFGEHLESKGKKGISYMSP